MAIPFALPCDEDCSHASEAHLEQLLWDLIDIYQQIQQIQILLRSRMHTRTMQHGTLISARVSAHLRHATTTMTTTPTSMMMTTATTTASPTAAPNVVVVPDLVASNLPPLEADGVETLAMPTLRLPRWQTSPTIEFKPGYYRENVITDCTLSQSDECVTFAPSTDCIDAAIAPMARLEPPSPSPAAADKRGLFARLLPTRRTSCSLWTAVLCVVGWRLFRGR